MGSKYTTNAASGYNSSPPPDDGTQVASNLIAWSGIKTKLADPVKTLADAIDADLVSVLNLSARAVSSDETIAATDHWRTIQVSSGAKVTLPDAATVAAGFVVSITNVGTSSSHIARTTGADTINGVAQDLLIPPGCAVTLLVNAAANGWITQSARNVDLSICEGRLTLTTGTPVTTNNVSSATTVYFTPYKGNRIALFDGTGTWNIMPFSELSVACPSTSSLPFDIFAYNSSSVVALETLDWSNDTSRATNITLQNGVYCKAGDLTRRYLGTGRTIAGVNGRIDDTQYKRYLWNYYNQTPRLMEVREATNSWTYSVQTYRQVNASTLNQLDFVVGVSEQCITATAISAAASSGATYRVASAGIGVDSTTANSALSPISTCNSSQIVPITVIYRGYPGVGRHYLAWLEWGEGTDAQTWYGDNGATIIQSGLSAEIKG